MHIYGLDFTSALSRGKPITCAECELEGEVLRLVRLGGMASFKEFEAFLGLCGPWVAEIDFPFGQPRRLIENLDWACWAEYVQRVSGMTLSEFVATLAEYRSKRSKGDKQHLRTADQEAGSAVR